MRRTSVFVTMAFLAGLAIGLFARNAGLATLLGKNPHAADLAAIEKLHRADVEATLTQDATALTILWSDDAVNLGFPTPAVGIKSIHEAYEKFRAQHPDFKVLKYAPEIKDVQIADGWAIEVGDFGGTYRMSAKDNAVNVQGEGMRVLKRQRDGSWRFALVGLK
jgi:ketosteroid isomerase-like protein